MKSDPGPVGRAISSADRRRKECGDSGGIPVWS